MKKYLLYLFGVFVVFMISLSFMDVSNEADITEEVSSEFKSASFFQLGAFTDKNEAEAMKMKYNCITEYDGEYYYVYFSILFDDENKSKIIDYLNRNSINYYVKNKSMDMNKYKEALDLESLMKSTNTDLAMLKINRNILSNYEVNNEN